MNKLSISLIVTLLCTFISCSNTKTGNENENTPPQPETLNISVFLDLSDRLMRDLTPSQMERDTAIVGYIVDYFKAKTCEFDVRKNTYCL